MKRLFNRTKRPDREWEGYDETDWDSVDENEEGGYDADPELNDDGEVYDADGYTDPDAEPFYADDADGDASYGPGSDEMYDAFGEDAEPFYADGDASYGPGPDGMYDAVGEDVQEDADLFYADDADGGYNGDGYEAGQEEYPAEEYEAEEYDPEGYEPEDEPAAVPYAGAKKGFAAKFRQWLSDMTVLDKAIFGTGAAVLVLALVTGVIYISGRSADGSAKFVDVGAQLDGIDTIGESGLLAVADAQMAKMAAASAVAEEMDPDEDEDYNEQAFEREIQVDLEFTSIQRDLKIKFINKKTGKLIANVPFSVSVTDPDGKTQIWSDDDMDGIIYKKDITAGDYKVAMEALTDEKYADYIISTTSKTTTVKKDIVYEKVDVANEIKTEDEIDVSQEDTKVNETVVESTLKDTVAWVESAQYPASYIEVPLSSITNPMTTLSQAMSGSFRRASSASEGDLTTPSPSPTAAPELTVTLNPAVVTVVAGQTITAQADVKIGGTAASGAAFSVSPASSGTAAVTVDSTGKVTIKGVAAGTATFTITAKKEGAEGKASITVTVVAKKSMTLSAASAIAFVGEPFTLTASIPEAVTKDPVVQAVSSETSVATVSVNKTTVTVNGLKPGTTTITVSFTENNETVQAQCVVTVKAHPKDDTTTKLTNSEGVQVYVLENDKYREATYADYYKASVKFYVMGEVKYTGWQTLNGNVYFFTADGMKVTGEQIIQGAKYTFASDGSLVTGSGALGIDVSKWNGNIDWNAVKNSGINYVIIRCGYRGSSAGSLIEDPKFTANIKGATSVGLKVGVYFFTQAIDEREAVEEASMVLGQIKNYKISYPVFLDVESSGGRADSIDKATRTAVCRAFCQTIQNAGYTAGVYANKNWWENKIDAGALSAYKIWLAQYAAAPTYKGRYDLWQYRSTGQVSGIKGNVDMNLSYLGY